MHKPVYPVVELPVTEAAPVMLQGHGIGADCYLTLEPTGDGYPGGRNRRLLDPESCCHRGCPIRPENLRGAVANSAVARIEIFRAWRPKTSAK
jgi:hypothetical protein